MTGDKEFGLVDFYLLCRGSLFISTLEKRVEFENKAVGEGDPSKK